MSETQFTDEYWMQHAYEQAALAAAQGEIPVGAIIVSQNQIIGQGFNAPITLNDPTAHAEIVALRDACQNIQNYRLPEDAVLYVTLEPCTMCVGALVHSRVSRVVFGAFESKAGSLVSARQLFETGYYNHVFPFKAGCMQQQCSEQLSVFFKVRREQKRQLKLQEKSLNTQK
ncbi:MULTISPECIES: tRNA adenosine(34) deaminase TadA [Acinetobacter]|uniref:tRNA-specific adenosine deaminase n=1 Tax=Acinetobacter pecorum TaxID=2762215 RepID=A0ABR8VVJ9_9GAMM|nr:MULTISPECIES: tRNA adenosine(34) deaminase TadA [Acinetobacter]MBD8008546.1 tRNA adenosine(34) deaminase TadA [Acinetobacter pecorum]OAL77120.1 adenosine deaminase [Acinetobacter sp. SFA]